MEISPVLLFFILGILIILALTIINAINDDRRLAAALRELSLRTGLDYGKGLAKSPSLEGEFRGHHISMKRVIIHTDGPRAEDGGSVEKYMQVTITLRKVSEARLELRTKKLSDMLWPFGKELISIANHDLRWDVNIIGKPPEFIRNVIDLISHADPHLFSWLRLNKPTITFDGSTLVCMQDALTYIDLQVSLLNLYSDITDLAESTHESA